MLKLDPDTWEFRVDNEFAKEVFQGLGFAEEEQSSSVTTRLCEQCRDLHDQISSPSLDITYDVPELKNRAQQRACDLCVLLWRTCEQYEATSNKTVRFEREHSMLRINGSGTRVLSIFSSPGDTPIDPQAN